ncbi:hypothetical protein KFU94_68095 [Chloroflexi bacterium TSY]|nr:hypothetical protein [Chloroflexi bacterium TSY]
MMSGNLSLSADYTNDDRFGELELEAIQELLNAAIDAESLQEFETHIVQGEPDKTTNDNAD